MAKSPSVAADIMQRELLTVHEGQSLQEAMQIMTENHVTGLPVVNSNDKCVGIISASDILSYEQEHSEFTAEANADMAQHFNMDTQQWESVRVTSYALEEFGEVKVSEVMARDLVYVDQQTSLTEVAKMMIKQKVHRILVLDDSLRIYGLISSFDFVRLYAAG